MCTGKTNNRAGAVWKGCSMQTAIKIKKLQDRRLKIVQDFNHGYIKPRTASRLVAAINRKIEEEYNGQENENCRI